MSRLNPKIQDMISKGISLTAEDALMIESVKSRDSTIYPYSVELEPAFSPFREPNFLEPTIKMTPNTIVPAVVNCSPETVQIWFKPEQQPHWSSFEGVIKSLSGIKSPIILTIQGNSQCITHSLTYDKELSEVITTVLKSHFPSAWLQRHSGNPLEIKTNVKGEVPWFSGHHWDFREYYPNSPYWSDFTVFSSKDRSLLIPVYTALSQIEKGEQGFYQVIFQPVRNDWKANIQHIRTMVKAIRTVGIPEKETIPFHNDSLKTNPDQSLFACIIRIGVEVKTGSRLSSALNSLGIALQPFMAGGYPLVSLSKQAFLNVLKNAELVKEMLIKSLCYRAGMIVCSKELSGFSHFPDPETLKSPLFHCEIYRGSLPVQHSKESGVVIGINSIDKSLILPARVRELPVVIFGKTGKGKSHLLMSMILSDIAAGHTVIVIEPHGDLTNDLLPRIPKSRINDTVLIDLTDETHIFSYNPVNENPRNRFDALTDEMLLSIKRLFDPKSWGSSIERVLRFDIQTVLSVPGLTLASGKTLLSKTLKGEALRETALEYLQGTETEKFWIDEFPSLAKDSIDRVMAKLDRLLGHRVLGRMFSQVKGKFKLEEHLNRKPSIILIYAPAGLVGGDCVNVFGSIFLSQIYHLGLARISQPPDQRREVYVYIDEMARYANASLEDSIRELRKFKIRLTLSFQQFDQMHPGVTAALSNMGSLITFGIAWQDVQSVYNEFGKSIEPDAFLQQDVGEAFVLFENRAFSFRTIYPPPSPDPQIEKAIRERSRKLYYVPAEKLKLRKSSIHKIKMNGIKYDEV
ncbi:MAG: type IV secretion system DNA-binding domain-containing protein [Candidatus Paceibacterota bacterium]